MLDVALHSRLYGEDRTIMTRLIAHQPRFACGSWPQMVTAGAMLLACGTEPAVPDSAVRAEEPAAGASSSAQPGEELVRPVLSLEVPVAELLGGQSGVEGGCALSETIAEVAPDQQLEGFGYRVSDVLAFAEGTHTTELRWATLDPPDGASPGSEALSVELSLAGLATAQRGCGNSFQIPVSYHVRSASGALELEGLSMLMANRERAHLQAELRVESLPTWLAAASPVLNLATGMPVFALDLALFADQTLRGSFVARGTGMCQLAAWPVEPTCPNGRALDVNDPTHGPRVSELFQLLEVRSIPELSFSDGTLTELSLSVESSPVTACVGRSVDANGILRPGDVYSAPLQLRIQTADGRIDVVVPAQAAARFDAGAWSAPAFFTGGNVVAPAAGFGHLALEPLGLTGRAALLLSAGLSQGDLRISSFAPHSPALRDVVNPGCISVPTTLIGQEFAGVTSDVLSARWP